MAVSIWEGNKAQALIDAVKSGGNEIGITQNFANALLNVFDRVGFIDTNGPIALSQLRDVMNSMLSDSFVSMTEYYVVPNYGPAVIDGDYYGAVYRTNVSRSLLVSELQSIKIPAKSSTSVSEYDTEIPYSFVKIPAGATQIKQINTAEVAFVLRPLIYDGQHFVKDNPSFDYFTVNHNTYADISNWNDGNYYAQMWTGDTVESGTVATIIFR